MSRMKLSPGSIQYLPGLECEEDAVEMDISQAACSTHGQVLQVREGARPFSILSSLLQVTFLCNTWFGLNSSLLLLYKMLQKRKRLEKVLVEKVGTFVFKDILIVGIDSSKFC